MRPTPTTPAFILRFIAASTILSALAAPASAITIVSHYRQLGATLGGIGQAGAPSTNTVGGGDFVTIFRAAAGVWEDLILDDFTLTLNFGWYPTEPISLTAFHQATQAGGTPRREQRGSIAFNNENARRWFLDPTPLDHSEFGPLDTARTDLGAGLINTRRDHVPIAAEAIGSTDLFSVALHEIGHALGLTGYDFFENEVADGDIDLTLALFVGAAIPIDGPHIDLSGPSLSSRGRPVGYRREISDVDVLAVSEVSNFTQPVLSPGADFTGDRQVNADDLAIWTTAFSVDNQADATGDVLTDGADFLAWQRQLTPPNEPPITPLPEPTAAILLSVGWMVLSARRLAPSTIATNHT